MGALGFILFCITVMAIYSLRYFSVIGYPSSYTLTPFQGGVLYRRGKPVRDVGPGKHRVFAGTEKIFFLDKRPVQANFEGRAVALADGAVAIYGFAASAQVSDVRKALHASSTYTKVPAFVTLAVTRGLLNRCQTSQVVSTRAAIEEDMVNTCRSRLAAFGFELNAFRLTQLSIASPAPGTN